MKILVTGFEPFSGEKINPAQEAINLHNPNIVISIGQADGRFNITPERIAINIDDFVIKDNEGNQPTDRFIREDGEIAKGIELCIDVCITYDKDISVVGGEIY